MSEGFTLILLSWVSMAISGEPTRIKRLDERSPIIRIGDDLVVVATVEQHVSLGMADQEEAYGNLHFAAGAVLDDRLVEVQRPGAEHVELHFFGASAAIAPVAAQRSPKVNMPRALAQRSSMVSSLF